MITFKNMEPWRQPDPMGRPQKEGDQFCFFRVPSHFDQEPITVVANGEYDKWEHVSMSLRHRTPRWSETCQIKDLFWTKEHFVIQFHPSEKDYVNNMRNCLHLWRYCGDFPTPPVWMVGVKELGTLL